MIEVEVILGQIVAKANNYQAVPDGAGGRRMIKNSKVRAYEQSFIRQCKTYAGRMIDRPFELSVKIFYRHNNFDLDNSLKTLLDCLQYAGAITNDNLCKRIVADKRIDPYRPRVEFSIIPEPAPPLCSMNAPERHGNGVNFAFPASDDKLPVRNETTPHGLYFGLI